MPILRATTLAFLLIALTAALAQTAHAQTNANWINPEGGRWFDAENWDTGSLPEDSADGDTDVVIDLAPGNPYSIFGSANGTIGSLTIDSDDVTVDFFGSNLRVENAINVFNGNTTFQRGSTINAGEINFFTDLNLLERFVIFERAKLGGDFSLTTGQIDLTKGATFSGRLALNDKATLRVRDESSESKTAFDDAFIVLSDSKLEVGFDNQLTLGSSSEINGDGYVGAIGKGQFHNEGTIVANVFEKTLDLTTGSRSDSSENEPERFINRGTLIARNGGTLTVQGPDRGGRGGFINDARGKIIVEKDSEAKLFEQWSSEGLIEVQRYGKLTLGGDFTSDDARTVIARRDSEVQVSGVWNNEGDALNLNQRSDNYKFNFGTLTGGVVHAKGAPLRFSGGNLLDSTRFVGNILVENDSSLLIRDSAVVGGIELSSGSNLTIENSGLFEFNQLTTAAGSRVAITSDNTNIRWNSNQRLDGAGSLLLGHRDQRARNFGVMNSNIEDETLLLYIGTGSTSFFANRGLLQSENGGHLHIDNRRSFYNHPEGTIRAGVNSTIRFEKDNDFVNEGNIELDEGSSLFLEGRYRTSFLDSISKSDSSVVHLEGWLFLKPDETFDFNGNYAANTATISGGSIDFTGSDPAKVSTLRIVNSSVVSDVNIGESSEIRFSSSAEVTGNVFVDGGKLNIENGVSLRGNVFVDGSESTFTAFSNIALNGTTTTLSNGARIIAGGSGRAAKVAAGGTLTGNGVVNEFLSFNSPSLLVNEGLIDASGSDGRLEFFTGEQLGPSFRNLFNYGTVSAQNGGQIIVGTSFWQENSNAEIVLNDGSISIGETLSLLDGQITGTGTIEAERTYLYGGKISPGVGIGRLDIVGDVIQGPTGLFDNVSEDMDFLFEIAGLSESQSRRHDLLAISGNLELGIGDIINLQVDTLADVSIQDLNDFEFSIISVSEGNEINGSFANVLSGGSLTSLDGRFEFDVFYGTESSFNPRDVTLTNFRANTGGFSFSAVPEPNSILMIIFVSTAMSVRRRRTA